MRLPRFALAPLAFLALLALAAPGDAGGGGPISWGENLDKAIDEAKQRHVPILVVFIDDKDKDCDRLIGGAFSSARFVDYVNEWAVPVIGENKGHHEPVKQMDAKTKKPVDRCPRFPTIPCGVHESVFAAAAGSQFVWTSFPAVYVCRPDGEIIVDQKDIREWSGDLIVKKLEEVLKKIGGEPVPRSRLVAVEAELKRGDAYLDKGQFQTAATVYEKVAKDKKLLAVLRKLAEKRLEALDQKELALVEEAKALEDKRAAVVRLRKLAADFKGRPAGKAAHDAADEIEKKPAAKKPADGAKPDEGAKPGSGD